MKGRIKFIKHSPSGTPQKGSGFGFITDEQGADRFFHWSDVEGTTFGQLKDGLAVEFEPTEGSGKGLRAARVRVSG